MIRTLISGTGLFTPSQTISNEELVESFNTWVERFNATHSEDIAAGRIAARQASSSAFIEKASGIRSRHVIDKQGILDVDRMRPNIPERSNDQWSLQCEMAVSAAREAMSRSGRSPSQIDAVIVACSNLQRAYPAVAVEVQAALEIEGYAFDMNVACSSATFGIQAAAAAVGQGAARAVLVISPEICSAHLNFRDRDSHFIFGDACTAVVVEAAEQVVRPAEAFEIIDTRLLTQFSNNIRNNFGFLNRCAVDSAVLGADDSAGPGADDKLFIQEGRKVFKEVVPMVSALISDHLQDNGIDPQRLRRMWLHQANLSMNQLISRKVLGREPEPMDAPTILDTYANTSSAGSIIAFHKYHDDLESGDIGVICSFGAGYSAGSVLLRKC